MSEVELAFTLFAQTMFGNLIAIRILRKFRDRSLISTTCLTKIGTAFALITTSIAICVAFSQPNDTRLSFFTVICAIVALQIFLRRLESRRIEMLLGFFPRFIDHWLLGLRVGLAPKSAAEEALRGTDDAFQTLIRPLLQSSEVPLDSRRHLFLRERILLELRLVQTQPHNIVPRLEALRDFLHRESDFRRKSGQALRQAAIQSAVMLALHFALSAFMVARSGWERSVDLILIATALSFFGAFLLRWLARRIKWSI